MTFSTNIDIASSEELVLTPKKQYKYPLPPFQMIGKKGMTRHKIEGFDPIPLLLTLTKPAANMLAELYKNKNECTNEAILETGNKTKAEKNSIFKGYKELFALGLVKRISKEHYLINPTAFIPTSSNYENVQTLWDSLP